MRLLAVLILAAAPPALAEGRVTWGVPLDRAAGPNALEIVRCTEGGCAARVTFRNSQLRGPAFTRRFTVEGAGLAVTVTIIEGALRAPDEIAVTPPPVFIAEPPRLAVEEDGTGTILILAQPMS